MRWTVDDQCVRERARGACVCVCGYEAGIGRDVAWERHTSPAKWALTMVACGGCRTGGRSAPTEEDWRPGLQMGATDDLSSPLPPGISPAMAAMYSRFEVRLP